jgi:hypothetical protein
VERETFRAGRCPRGAPLSVRPRPDPRR